MSYGNGKSIGLTVLLSVITFIVVIAVTIGIWYRVKGFNEIQITFHLMLYQVALMRLANWRMTMI